MQADSELALTYATFLRESSTVWCGVAAAQAKNATSEQVKEATVDADGRRAAVRGGNARLYKKKNEKCQKFLGTEQH